MNKFQFMGRLTRDPDRRFADANGERKTDFFNLTAFGRLADFCGKYYRKGQQVLVEGRIQNRSWDDQNGQKRYATDFIVENAYFADSRRDQDMPAGEVPSSSMDGEFITVEDTDELPF